MTVRTLHGRESKQVKMPLRRLFALTTVVAALATPGSVAAQPSPHVPHPTAVGTGGAAATVDSLATDAAIEMLEDGGNAVDATIAAASVLSVVEPFFCGIGGGGFMVIYNADDGSVTTIDGRETAPAAMRPDSFFENGTPLLFADARWSGLSAGVPGTVAMWAEALDRYGTSSLANALAPGIATARDGFVVDQQFHDQVQTNADFFDDITSTKSLYLDPDGTPPDVGTVLRNPDHARAYTRIAHLGTKGFYRGAIADAMVETVQNPPLTPDANHVWRPGVMSMRDVNRYAALEREPTHSGYRGLDVFGMGPPSSGGSTVGEALNILEGFPLGSLTREHALHYFLEASRYSFADRGAWVADPAFYDVPLAGLLSDGFAAERRSLIEETAAVPPVVPPGDPFPFDSVSATASASVEQVPGTTTHLTVSDREGNVVVYTFTIESMGGNGIVVPGWGFLLNNELTDFNFTSLTHPNRVEGRKRPRSSMAPTLLLDDGSPFLAVGSPGGSMIITTVLQVLIDRLDLGATLPEAILAPRLSQRNTLTTVVEPQFLGTPEATALAARGHTFSTMAEIGAVTGIEFLGDGRALAAAEPARRGGGSAMVVAPD